MLDLNVEIISGDDDRLMFVGKRAADAGEEETEHEEEENEHSAGTSDSSSVVNADEASAAANAGDEGSSAAFVFDVFKKEKAKEGSFPPELVTRQLFPVPSGSPDELGVGSVKPASAPRPQWLNLSFGRAGGGGGGSGDPPMTGEMKSFQQPQRQQQVRKSRRGPRSRSSQYRGVTFYRRTGRWESHIWDCGKQVYLGGFDTAYAAARAYDRAAIKFRGVDADINFNISDYEEDMKQMGNLTKEEFVHVLRRQSTGFSRGSSKIRGMAVMQKSGQWDNRVGQFLGKVPHDNVVIQCNSRDTGTNIVNGGYEQDIILDTSGEGSRSHNLDLNLGMPLPLHDSNKIKVGTGNSRFNSIDFEVPGRESHVVTCSNVVSAPNQHLPSWPAMYPFLIPSSEGKAMEKRTEAPVTTNFGWQILMNGNYGGTSASPNMPLMFSSNAASSGFSSSSSSNSSSTHHLIHELNAAPKNPNPQLHMKPGSINNTNNNNHPFPFISFRN